VRVVMAWLGQSAAMAWPRAGPSGQRGGGRAGAATAREYLGTTVVPGRTV
jgi:hypothetical protein